VLPYRDGEFFLPAPQKPVDALQVQAYVVQHDGLNRRHSATGNHCHRPFERTYYDYV
jgi:hypothetical protein